MVFEKKFETVDGYLVLSIPKNYKEITLDQFTRLSQTPISLLDEIAILSGKTKDELYNVRSLEGLLTLKDAVELLKTDMVTYYDAEQIPEKIHFPDGFSFKIDLSIGIQPIGAYFTVDEIIKNDLADYQEKYGEEWKNYAKPSLESILSILAHFLYCPVTKKEWKLEDVLEFENTVKHLKAVEALPLARAFFLPYLNIEIANSSYFKRLQTHYRNWRELKSLKNLAG